MEHAEWIWAAVAFGCGLLFGEIAGRIVRGAMARRGDAAREAASATGTFVSNPPYTSYAVGRDGRMLVASIPPLRRVSTVNVVLNWDVEIERLISEAEAKR